MQTLAVKWSAIGSENTVMVTHHVVVNAVVGAATGEDRMIRCHSDDADRTVIDKIGDHFNVVDYSLEEISDAALVT